MGKQELDLYTVFHLNLGFSCIPRDQYQEVVQRCYWPLLNWAEQGLARFGLEFPVETAKAIDRVDPTWTKKLLDLEKSGQIEIIGSGLVQSIFPLVPAEVNGWNLSLGLEGYRKLLGVTPETAYVHEQTYSSGLIDLYHDAGFKNLMFDWNNAIAYTSRSPYLKFQSPKLTSSAGKSLNLVWNKSVAFQRLQRYLYGDLDLSEYLSYLEQQWHDGAGGAFCFYGSDIEILDYRPGNADVLYGARAQGHEKIRLEELFGRIRDTGKFQWKLPKEVAKIHSTDVEVKLETADYPIPTKKQEKYNVTRWALGGRQNAKLNTLCYRAYEQLKGVSNTLPAYERERLWSSLCLAWASDFRTYTTEEKYFESQIKIGGLIEELEKLAPSEPRKWKPRESQEVYVSRSENQVVIRSSQVEVELSTRKGTIKSLRFPKLSDRSLIGLVSQGTFENISHSVDYFSGHTIVERAGAFRFTDLDEIKLLPSQLGSASVTFRHSSPQMTLWKTYSINIEAAALEIHYHFQFKDLITSSIRYGILTAIPTSFERASFWYATHNGGREWERFYLAEADAFDAGEAVSSRVTSAFCLGATENKIAFGDKEIGLMIECEKSEQYAVPLVAYSPLDSKFLFRLTHSMGEMDDTANTLWRGHVHSTLRLTGIRS